jgi:hypothetical protein
MALTEGVRAAKHNVRLRGRMQALSPGDPEAREAGVKRLRLRGRQRASRTTLRKPVCGPPMVPACSFTPPVRSADDGTT